MENNEWLLTYGSGLATVCLLLFALYMIIDAFADGKRIDRKINYKKAMRIACKERVKVKK